MSGASGRLWLTGDGRGRIELQSNAGDVQIVWNSRRSRVYDASSNTVYRADLPAHERQDGGRRGHAADARRDRQVPDRPRRPLGASPAAAADRRRRSARLQRVALAEARRRPARLGRARLGRRPGRCRSASAIYAQGALVAGARACGDGHLATARSPAATSTSRRRRARRSSTSARPSQERQAARARRR